MSRPAHASTFQREESMTNSPARGFGGVHRGRACLAIGAAISNPWGARALTEHVWAEAPQWFGGAAHKITLAARRAM
jgi:hypothetical protein